MPNPEVERKREYTHPIAIETKATITYHLAESFTTLDGSNLSIELKKFETLYWDELLRGNEPVVLAIIEGAPSAGKDWLTNHVMTDYLSYVLLAERFKARLWEDAEIELINEKKINPDPRLPFSSHELLLSHQRLKRNAITDLLCGEKYSLVQYPSGTAYQFGEIDDYGKLHQKWLVTREYGDKTPQHILKALNKFDPKIIDKLMLLQVQLLRGPWMDVLAWYRHFILYSESLQEASFYNTVFGFAPFDSYEEMLRFKNGSSAVMVEKSQQAVRKVVEAYISSTPNLPPIDIKNYQDDIQRIAYLLEINPRHYAIRVEQNFELAHLFNRNAQVVPLLTSMPHVYQRIIAVNNPELYISDREFVRILIRQEKARLGMIPSLAAAETTRNKAIIDEAYLNFRLNYPIDE